MIGVFTINESNDFITDSIKQSEYMKMNESKNEK